MRSHFGILLAILLYIEIIIFYKISTMGLLNSNVKGESEWTFYL